MCAGFADLVQDHLSVVRMDMPKPLFHRTVIGGVIQAEHLFKGGRKSDEIGGGIAFPITHACGFKGVQGAALGKQNVSAGVFQSGGLI